MFNNVALDVAISFTFVYLLYSLLASIVQENIAQLFALRARMLYKGIRRMLEDDAGGELVIDKFYKAPVIKYLSENKLFDKPSYIDSKTFVQGLLYILTQDNTDPSLSPMQIINKRLNDEFEKISGKKKPGIAPDTLNHLRYLYKEANGDKEKFSFYIQQWFENTMARTSGWYKRQTQVILLCIGLVIAGVTNLDSIKLYKILSVNKASREQIVQLALNSENKYTTAVEKIRQATPDTVKVAVKNNTLLDKAYNSVEQDAVDAGSILGMGWYSSNAYKKLDSLNRLKCAIGKPVKANEARSKELQAQIDKISPLVYDKFDGLSIVGWLITALALSLGAPFWFDLLSKLVNIRGTGVKPNQPEGTKPVDTSDTVNAETVKVMG